MTGGTIDFEGIVDVFEDMHGQGIREINDYGGHTAILKALTELAEELEA